jgi:hypothetical protein
MNLAPPLARVFDEFLYGGMDWHEAAPGAVAMSFPHKRV